MFISITSLFWEIILLWFSGNIFWSLELGLFTFFYSHYYYTRSFYSIPDFLDILLQNFFRFNIFWLMYWFILLYLPCLWFSLPRIVFCWWCLCLLFLFSSLDFHLQYWLSLCFRHCFCFHFRVLNSFIHFICLIV